MTTKNRLYLCLAVCVAVAGIGIVITVDARGNSLSGCGWARVLKIELLSTGGRDPDKNVVDVYYVRLRTTGAHCSKFRLTRHYAGGPDPLFNVTWSSAGEQLGGLPLVWGIFTGPKKTVTIDFRALDYTGSKYCALGLGKARCVTATG